MIFLQLSMLRKQARLQNFAVIPEYAPPHTRTLGAGEIWSDASSLQSWEYTPCEKTLLKPEISALTQHQNFLF